MRICLSLLLILSLSGPVLAQSMAEKGYEAATRYAKALQRPVMVKIEQTMEGTLDLTRLGLGRSSFDYASSSKYTQYSCYLEPFSSFLLPSRCSSFTS